MNSFVAAGMSDRGWLTIGPRTEIVTVGSRSALETVHLPCEALAHALSPAPDHATKRRKSVEAVTIPSTAATTSTAMSAGLYGVPINNARSAFTS